jgi:transposase
VLWAWPAWSITTLAGIVWCSSGRDAETLRRFFEEFGERKMKTVSIDMSGGLREGDP